MTKDECYTHIKEEKDRETTLAFARMEDVNDLDKSSVNRVEHIII